jgi:ABC-type uncharacterized transport system fused permease/ATPase subunit
LISISTAFFIILLSGPGERLLGVGPSGGGKTSVLRGASGLWEPTMGSVKRQVMVPPSESLPKMIAAYCGAVV